MPKYIIQKTLYGFNYYYDSFYRKWEGLIENAYPMELSEAQEIARSLSRAFPDQQVTVKTIKTKKCNPLNKLP